MRAVTLPYRPAAHTVHALVAEPPTLKRPSGQGIEVVLVEPAGQKKPWTSHTPAQAGNDSPLTLPNTPAGHGVQALALELL